MSGEEALVVQHGTPLAELTTLRVGGPAERLVTATDTASLMAELRELWRRGDDWLLLGGGSNLLVGDDPVPGTVLQVATKGIWAETAAETAARGSLGRKRGVGEFAGGVSGIRDNDAADASDDVAADTVIVHVAAGESWDALVSRAVSEGWAGIEALSGIPGSVGAAPMQNIGAYGQELADTLISVVFLDYLADAPVVVPAAELELGYRSSALKSGRAGAVLGITLALRADDGWSAPIGYAQLASALGVAVGDRAPLAEVRAAVLALRSSKGMVLDAADPDSVSAGSFFTNPIVPEAFARQLPVDAPRWSLTEEPAPTIIPLATDAEGQPVPAAYLNERGAVPSPYAGVDQERQVKLSAAWLIENSGIGRGFRLPGSRVGVSSKHTLALVNLGGGTAAQVAELTRLIQSRVAAEFGIVLQPEPVRIGIDL